MIAPRHRADRVEQEGAIGINRTWLLCRQVSGPSFDGMGVELLQADLHRSGIVAELNKPVDEESADTWVTLMHQQRPHVLCGP